MKIEYPAQTTYFICKNLSGKIIGYGKIEPEQVMETKHPTLTYLNENEWKQELHKNNIELETTEIIN